ncbi:MULTISPECIES: AarF/ABC1/UbiB kinase family protein [Micrococcaceae]|uniref:ABC1 kinase family protein n=1 Tax=Micrococcaceae TaxID=1268 RepID=UPI00160CBC8B|nr:MULTISPECIES: AarF/UbiB family protein [Micrococcaceae]MBB5749021.1 ubiquinone biosynthesis protein [Micrococcus sp. TA1]HRO31181.1 AarF/UbiB family protein [Citricoccus sp.]HRO94534.1 AarF/UbiB family protein [Citricoccus sp.]
MGSRAERYREIAEVFSVHGFGFVVSALGLSGRFPFHRIPRHASGQAYSRPEHVRMALEELGPTFVKMGQILSTRPDLLPPPYVRELSRLQDQVGPIPAADVMAVLTEELGSTSVFDGFERKPLASASIGQAHAATLDGVEVVVKVRRPGVVETVNQDLDILENLAQQATRRWDFARDHDVLGLVREFSETLHHELDYLREGRNAEQFARNFADDPAVHIPVVHWETTSSRVLTLERIRGIKIHDVEAISAAGIDRSELAERATGVLCRMVFEHGVFHADPHPGNFFVEEDGTLGIIDFGMVGTIDDELKETLGDILVAIVRGDPSRATSALLRLNRSPERVDRAALKEDAGALIERFSGHSISDLPVSALINDVLRMLRRHRLHLPNDLAMLFKMLVMAEGLGRRLDPDFHLAVVLAPFTRRLVLQRYSLDALRRRLGEVVDDVRQAGEDAPRLLQSLVDLVERGGPQLTLGPEELEHQRTHSQLAGNRIVAGLLAASFIHVAGGIVATSGTGRTAALRGPVAAASAGAAGLLGGYLAFSGRRRRRR